MCEMLFPWKYIVTKLLPKYKKKYQNSYLESIEKKKKISFRERLITIAHVKAHTVRTVLISLFAYI